MKQIKRNISMMRNRRDRHPEGSNHYELYNKEVRYFKEQLINLKAKKEME